MMLTVVTVVVSLLTSARAGSPPPSNSPAEFFQKVGNGRCLDKQHWDIVEYNTVHANSVHECYKECLDKDWCYGIEYFERPQACLLMKETPYKYDGAYKDAECYQLVERSKGAFCDHQTPCPGGLTCDTEAGACKDERGLWYLGEGFCRDAEYKGQHYQLYYGAKSQADCSKACYARGWCYGYEWSHVGKPRCELHKEAPEYVQHKAGVQCFTKDLAH